MTEEDLLKGCLEERQDCQRELYKRFAGKMMVVCIRYAKDKLEAEDMLQDGFIKVFDNIGKFKQEGSLEGWVRRIMVNTALNKIRTNKMKFEDIAETGTQLIDGDSTIIDKLSEEAILDIISRLPNGYKYVFNMFAIEGFSHKEIAEKLGIEEASSRSQYAKARKYLQNQIIQLEQIKL
ncbi:MAG: sigma-70 family RNA polymerase sigma factor [bacterium]|nr:sigma-70 family RNA polymerase sigma factor [bacterium]